MANICITLYTITGNKKEVKYLYNLMKRLEKESKSERPYYYGDVWLNLLAESLGEDLPGWDVRGDWDDLEFDGNILTFRTLTAWGPLNKVWDCVIKKFPSLKYYFQAEERGEELYCTNDSEGLFYYPYKFMLYSSSKENGEYDEEELSDGFDSVQEVIEWIERYPGRKIRPGEDIQSFIERVNEEYPDITFSLIECEIV